MEMIYGIVLIELCQTFFGVTYNYLQYVVINNYCPAVGTIIATRGVPFTEKVRYSNEIIRILYKN